MRRRVRAGWRLGGALVVGLALGGWTQGPPPGAPKPWVVIGTENIPTAARAQLDTYFKKAEFAVEKGKDATFAFSPDVVYSPAQLILPQILSWLGDGTKPKTVRLDRLPPVERQQVEQVLLASPFGGGLGGLLKRKDVRLQVIPVPILRLDVGGRERAVDLDSPVNNAEMAEAVTPEWDGESSPTDGVGRRQTLSVEFFGASLPSVVMRQFTDEAMARLIKRQALEKERLSADVDRAIRSRLGTAGDIPLGDFESLPGWVRDGIRDRMMRNYEVMGFPSPGEAASAMERSRVTRSRWTLMMSVSGRGKDGVVHGMQFEISTLRY